MAYVNQTGDTPSKTDVSAACTPTTKKQVCVICGKREESNKHRVQLFKNDKKTETCILIEKYLEIQLIPGRTVNSVCQNCKRSLNNIHSRIQVHKQNYEKTVSQLKSLSKKRLLFDDLPVRTFQGLISPDLAQVSTLCTVVLISPGVVTPYIKVYGDVPQVWVMLSHLLVFIRIINSRF